jgi:hypothetical protein
VKVDDRHDGKGSFFSQLAEELAPRLADELRGIAGWVDQRDTPLGRNTHCAAVRRRLDEAGPGEDCGAMIGGTKSAPIYKLSHRALREELRGIKPGLRKTRGSEPPPSYRTQLLNKLRGLR